MTLYGSRDACNTPVVGSKAPLVIYLEVGTLL